jgi:hypothetical protein
MSRGDRHDGPFAGYEFRSFSLQVSLHYNGSDELLAAVIVSRFVQRQFMYSLCYAD